MFDAPEQINDGSLRDSYGFVVPPAYCALHQQFAPIWAEEELEREARWDDWFQSLTSSDINSDGIDCTDQLLARALSQYVSGPSSMTPTSSALLQQLRALVQMGCPRKHRARCWKLFLDLDVKRKPGEYDDLVSHALAVEPPNERDAEPRVEAFGDHAPHEHVQYDTPSRAHNDEDGKGTCDFARTPISSPCCFPPTTSASLPHPALDRAEVLDWLSQIDKDLHRTFPGHESMDEQGRAALRRVLAAYACRNPTVGYCQGLNFLAAAFLLLFPEEDAFWALATIVEDLLPGYFDSRMVAVQVDLRAFAHLLAFACPRVASHLEDLQVDIPSATSAWFLVAFLSSLPTESTFRLWDVLFFERSPIMIFRSALALFDIYSHALMETKESGDAYALLQAMAPMTCDASTLVDSASIAYGHIGEAALRVLRDRYSPEVLEAMRASFSCDSELESVYSLALSNRPLSRSQSLAEAFIAGAVAHSRPCTPASSLPLLRGTPAATPLTLSRRSPSPPRSPYASLSALKGNPAAARPNTPTIPEDPEEEISPLAHASVKQTPTTTGSGLGAHGQGNKPLVHTTSDMDVNGDAASVAALNAQDVRSPWPPPRRTLSSATAMASAAARRASWVHLGQHHAQRRLDLYSVFQTVPDLQHPAVAAAFRIACNPSPRKHAGGGGMCIVEQRPSAVVNDEHADRGDGDTSASKTLPCISSNDSKNDTVYSRTPLSLVWGRSGGTLQLENSSGDGSTAGGSDHASRTVDVATLAQTIKALRFEGGSPGHSTAIPRRFTDGGALMKPSAAARSAAWVASLGQNMEERTCAPGSPGTLHEKTAQLEIVREQLECSVEEASTRQHQAEEELREASEMGEALRKQLAKLQKEILEKVETLHALCGRVAEVEEQAAAMENGRDALRAQGAELDDKAKWMKEVTAIQAQAARRLMEAVNKHVRLKTNG